MIRFFRLGLVVLSLGLNLAAQAQVNPILPAGVVLASSVEGITEYRLPNGLQVLLVPDESKPSTTVNLTFRVGSRHENYGETGMAHLLEHLIFKGTPTTKNVWAEFTKRGLRANGTTWVDRTNYFASFNANEENLQWYLGWLADAMVNSFIAKDDLTSEMTVVRNEMEMGENNPGRILFERTLSAMYDWHNYGKSTIGARADVENVDISRLQAFYRQYYQPDNATLIVAGKFDAARTLAWVSQSFGRAPKPQRLLLPTYTLEPAQDGERQITVRRVGGTPLVYMAYHVPPGSHADFAAVALLTQVLGDTPGGRLHKRVVEKQWAAAAFGEALSFAEPGLMVVGAQLAPGQDLDKARTEIAAVLDGVAAEPVTTQELERARVQWLNAWDKGFNDPQIVGVALSDAISLGDWRMYFLKRDQIRKVTLADINRVASERLRADNRTVALYRPTAAPQRAPAPAKVDVAALVKDYKGDAQLAQAEVFEATPANLHSRTQVSALPSGLKVALLSKATRGKAVQARLALHFGDEGSLKGQETVASFVAAMLQMGGAGLTRQQISDRFDELRAQVGFGANGQTVYANIVTVREQLPATIELVGRLLREPAFPAESLEEARRQWLAGLEEQRHEPEAVVENAVQRHGNPYPRGDLRYAATFAEQESDIKAITVAQMQNFHRLFYSAAAGEFAAVGDFDAAAVNQALLKAFGDWKQAAAPAGAYTRLPRPAKNAAPVRLMLQTPDKQNATLMARLTLPVNDSHADYAALLLANRIVGGGGSSRLWKRIRETEGLSYDVRSGISWNEFEPNSTWVSTAIFAPQNQPKVEAAWREELMRSVQGGFTATELEEARTGLLNARRLQRAQDDATAAEAVGMLHLKRNFLRMQEVDDRIARVTLDETNAAWRRHFDINKLVVAWGGDFKKTP